MDATMKTLSEIAIFVTDKISSKDITLEQYVTTDCIFQDRRGRGTAVNLPPQSCALTKYQPGDVLVANIRPYLRKIWFADTVGGASADVLVLRAKSNHPSEFLYSVLLQDSFFEYAMQGAKGSKMPRGDKEQIMRFKIPTLSPKLEESIGKIVIDFNSKIHLNEQINQNLAA